MTEDLKDVLPATEAPATGAGTYEVQSSLAALSDVFSREPAPQRRGELHRILYVNDDPWAPTFTKLALEDPGGFVVAQYTSRYEALEAIPHFAPDLILLDLMMPGVDGPVALEALRRRPGCASIPVAFLMTKDQQKGAGRCTPLGAAGLIAKPFDHRTLCETVRRVWNGALAQLAVR